MATRKKMGAGRKSARGRTKAKKELQRYRVPVQLTEAEYKKLVALAHKEALPLATTARRIVVKALRN